MDRLWNFWSRFTRNLSHFLMELKNVRDSECRRRRRRLELEQSTKVGKMSVQPTIIGGGICGLSMASYGWSNRKKTEPPWSTFKVELKLLPRQNEYRKARNLRSTFLVGKPSSCLGSRYDISLFFFSSVSPASSYLAIPAVPLLATEYTINKK